MIQTKNSCLYLFADFVKVERITGEKIAEAILASWAEWDLPLQNLIEVSVITVLQIWQVLVQVVLLL